MHVHTQNLPTPVKGTAVPDLIVLKYSFISIISVVIMCVCVCVRLCVYLCEFVYGRVHIMGE